MLSDRFPVCLSVTLVYCGQTVEWIEMKLGMEVGLCPGHIALLGDTAPQEKGAQQPQRFGSCIVTKRLDTLKCHLVRR